MRFYMLKNGRFVPLSAKRILSSLKSGSYVFFNRWDNTHCVCKIYPAPVPSYVFKEWERAVEPGEYSVSFLRKIYEEVMK